MGVVGVDGHVAGQLAPCLAVLALEGVEQGADAGGNEQVLLLESEQAPVLAGVVGIQDGGDRLGVGAVAIGAGVVSGVEGVEIEVVVDGLCAPAAQLVHGLPTVPDNRDIVGHGQDVFGALGGVIGSIAFLAGDDVSTEADAHGLVGALDLPGVTLGEPFVGHLDLAPIDDFLLEEAVAVAHAVAVAGDSLVGHRVEEARGEAAESAVAERRVGLLALDLVQIAAHLGDGVCHEVANAQVDQVVVK